MLNEPIPVSKGPNKLCIFQRSWHRGRLPSHAHSS